MDWRRIDVLEVPDSGDTRGSSFPVPASWLDAPFVVADIHVSTVLPGHVRGDHYHAKRHEILIVSSGARWSLFFDDGPRTTAQRRTFSGTRAVLIAVPLLASHAIRNDGDTALHITGLTDGPYDPSAPDAFTRKVSTDE